MLAQQTRTRKPTVRKVPTDLRSGDRIIFSPPMGGTGETVTVESVSQAVALKMAFIHTKEVASPIEVLFQNTVKVVL
jgi:hypothetical protein